MATLAAHVFTGRGWPLGTPSVSNSGVPHASGAGDAAAWSVVATAVGVDGTALWRARQVHGAAVMVGGGQVASARPAADVVVVRQAGHAAAVQVADCIPLLMVDRLTGVVAAVHAGWRGLAARAPQVAVETLIERFGSKVTDIVVAVGPSIGACCYEVGPDVRRSFDEAGFSAERVAEWFHEAPVASAHNPSVLPTRRRQTTGDERSFFDTWAAAIHQVVALGVPAGQVLSADLCTASHPAVFCSYRRDGSSAGRQAAAIRCGASRP